MFVPSIPFVHTQSRNHATIGKPYVKIISRKSTTNFFHCLRRQSCACHLLKATNQRWLLVQPAHAYGPRLIYYGFWGKHFGCSTNYKQKGTVIVLLKATINNWTALNSDERLRILKFAVAHVSRSWSLALVSRWPHWDMWLGRWYSSEQCFTGKVSSCTLSYFFSAMNFSAIFPTLEYFCPLISWILPFKISSYFS